MTIPPIAGVGASPTVTGAPKPAAPGFGEAMQRGIQQVSDAEKTADRAAIDVATGGRTDLHQLMAETSKASLSVDLLVQVRNRAVEAYQEIMRIQV
ncbi:MAG: flagellar hook-basal body complex protein FliE [Actinobacteria bacterium]|nr:flagellar hook-basal body complex protein FliE [Actinomycetota bacterium]